MSLNFIGALALGVFVYYCTRPVYKFLKNRGVNRTVSALVAQLAFIIPSILLIAYTIQIIAFEIRSFATDASGIIADFIENQDIIQEITEDGTVLGLIPVEDDIESEVEPDIDTGEREQRSLRDILESIDADTISQVFDFSIETVTLLISSISGLFFTLFIAFSLSFYLQRDGQKIKSIIYETVEYDRTIIKFARKLDRDLKVVFLGNIALALATSVIGATTFYLITLIIPGGEMLVYPGLVGFLCGIASLIPVVGMKLVYFPVTALLFLMSSIQQPFPEGLIFPTVFFLVGLIIVDTIPDLVARPYLGSWSGISTSILLFSYVLGPLTFGWFGLFLGPLIFVAFYEFYVHIFPKIIEEHD